MPNSHLKVKAPAGRRVKAPGSMVEPLPRRVLSDEVTLTRQFQRAVRLDSDFGSVEALRGYICQGTARNVLEATARHVLQTPQRAFIWTGPFGGGKSSLAVALCSLVAEDKAVRRAALDVLNLADAPQSDISRVFAASNEGWLVLPVVGHRGSVVDAVTSCLDERAGTRLLRATKAGTRQRASGLFKALENQAAARAEGGKNGLLLVIDELGKFLESSTGDGDDIYFYQELADLAGRCAGKLIVVGILHQSFEQYAYRLGSDLRDEWRKVQGRYIDIPLIAASDEVVELAGRAIHTTLAHPTSMQVAQQVAESIRHRRPGLSADFAERLDRCWPLHPVTAALLGPVSKRRFGQNERSTFGFLASVEARSFREFLHATDVGAATTYTPAAYWDYLRTNLEPSILASTDSHRWSQSVEAVERTEHKNKGGAFHVELVKTIALIDLFRNGSGLVADEAVLGACVRDEGGAELPSAKLQELLEDLRRWALITFKRHQGSWAISEGSDFDLDAALADALATVDEPDLTQLASLLQLQPVLAKRHYCNTGTLRWMVPVMSHANRFLDGLERATAVCGEPGASLGRSSAFGAFLFVLPARGQTIRQAAAAIGKVTWEVDARRPILVGIPRNGEAIRELGRELMAYDKIRRHRSELENDAVGRRELEARTTDVRSRLEEELRDALQKIHWINADVLKLARVDGSSFSLAQLASTLADQVFSKGPFVFSELINRDLPSSNSIKARKDLLYAMLARQEQKRLGLEGYPAEAGLYHNLLEASGLHRPADGQKRQDEDAQYTFMMPAEDQVAVRAATFLPLWSAAEDLIVKAQGAVPLNELYALWQAPPYGVRGGVLPVLWLAFLLANQHRLALYKDGMFVPQIRPVDIDEAQQDPSRFAMRHIQINEHRRDILKGVAKHLAMLGRPVQAEPLEAARGLVAMVFDLPAWSRRTLTMKERTRAVRDTLAQASDPHRVLFVDLPVLFGDLPVPKFLEALGDALQEMQSAYPVMISGVMNRMLNTLDASFASVAEIDMIRRRCQTVIGISGDFRLDAFAGRLSVLTPEPEAVDGLLSMAVNKPPTEWSDQDIDAALIELARLALKFRQIEAVSSVQQRDPTRSAIAVVFGTGGQGKSVFESFDVPSAEDAHIRHLSDLIVNQFKTEKREIVLAALAQAGTRLVEESKVLEGEE